MSDKPTEPPLSPRAAYRDRVHARLGRLTEADANSSARATRLLREVETMTSQLATAVGAEEAEQLEREAVEAAAAVLSSRVKRHSDR